MVEQDHFVPPYNWAIGELTPEERAKSLQPVMEQIRPLVEPGMRIADICCGSGAAAFILEELGAEVLAVDMSPYLLELARREAARRGSKVRFVQADVLAYPFEPAAFELAVCLGNPILDFPPERFGEFRDNVHQALREDGRLVLEHYDGIRRYLFESQPPELLAHEEPEKISRSFKGYDPASGAYMAEYRNHTRGETCEYRGYIYTAPLVRLVLEPRFALESSFSEREGRFLDVFVRR